MPCDSVVVLVLALVVVVVVVLGRVLGRLGVTGIQVQIAF